MRSLLTAVFLAAVGVSAHPLAQSAPPVPPLAVPQAVATGFDTSELVNAAHQLNADDLPRLQARADSGEGRAQVLLGLAYEMGGAGLKPQPPMALSWFLKAAEQGITWAQVWAADFYLSGSDGIERDVSRALMLYRSAADHGDPKAPFFVGQIYFYGDGVPADHQQAAAWYRRARASDVPVVEPMIALTATPCSSAFCIGLRQVVAAIMTESANRFIDGWDEAKHEWDSTITLPDSERCGLTSADRTNAGEVQNYFCDSAQYPD
jgi:hypothetical protein